MRFLDDSGLLIYNFFFLAVTFYQFFGEWIKYLRGDKIFEDWIVMKYSKIFGGNST